MSAAAILLATTGLLAAGGLVESISHRRRLEQISTRVHVNGTARQVERRPADRRRVCGPAAFAPAAKTTGTLPRMILPDGTRVPGLPPVAGQRHRAVAHRRGGRRARGRGAGDRVHGADPLPAVAVREPHGAGHARRDHQRPRRPPGRDGPHGGRRRQGAGRHDAGRAASCSRPSATTWTSSSRFATTGAPS